MRIMITGSTGFLGKALFRRLVNRYPNSQIFGVSSKDVDLRDADATYTLNLARKPDVIFHLAARVGGIGANQLHPVEFARDNLLMGINVLEAARRYRAVGGKMPRVVMIGTCCSYPRDAPIPLKEESLWDGYPETTNAPYGIAKRTLVMLGETYRAQFGMDVRTIIPANLYGPGDHFDAVSGHVIPAMIVKFLRALRAEASEVTLWGTGCPRREFLYVEDAIEAIETLGLDNAYVTGGQSIFNIGTGRDVVIRNLAQLIAEMIGYKGSIHWDASKPDGQPQRILDCSRAYRHGFVKPTTALEDGLKKTIDWARANVRIENNL